MSPCHRGLNRTLLIVGLLLAALAAPAAPEFHQPRAVHDVDRLDPGHALLSATAEIVWITNPASGVELYCHVHRPADFNSQQTYPGIVLAPGGNGTGAAFDNGNIAQQYANLGFVVMHFDPDGRGLSTNGGTYTTENYCGYLQQEGLHQVLLYLAALPETNNAKLGIVTSSYGITLGAGVAGRYPNNPPVKFLMDWEGPADRTDTAQPVGHVPHDPNDDAWWYAREPTNFIDNFGGYYLRVQSVVDHVQADNEHALKLLNAATNLAYGGAGHCWWTRCNSASGFTQNTPNAIYSLQSQPEYLPESVNVNILQREYLVELAALPPLPGDGDLDCDGTLSFADINPLVLALTDRSAYEQAFPTCDYFRADCNADASVDFQDINPFVSCIVSGGCP